MGTSERSKPSKPTGDVLREGDLAGLDALPESVNTLAVFCFADQRPLRGTAGYLDWRLCGELSETLLEGLFEGQADEVMLLPTRGRMGQRRVFAFGLGPATEANADRFEGACRHAAQILEKAGSRKFGLLAPSNVQRPELEKLFADVAIRTLGDRAQCVLVSPSEVV